MQLSSERDATTVVGGGPAPEQAGSRLGQLWRRHRDPSRAGMKYQEWVALQPIWLLVSTFLPHSDLWLALAVLPAGVVAAAWRRRWFPSPTVIGMIISPVVLYVAHRGGIQPADLVMGHNPMTKIVVSGVLIGCYSTARVVRWISLILGRIGRLIMVVARFAIGIFAKIFAEEMVKVWAQRERPPVILPAETERVSG